MKTLLFYVLHFVFFVSLAHSQTHSFIVEFEQKMDSPFWNFSIKSELPTERSTVSAILMIETEPAPETETPDRKSAEVRMPKVR